jgi:hypothetical protein
MKGRERVGEDGTQRKGGASYTFSQVIIQGGISKIPNYLKPEQGVA